ncbi:Lnb N-terminal periplasmic domain-containing protein [Xanthobacter versatilis]|uniref:Lnb N-terminal periplasmic domain-containing protein n=1 Tax=Xanthobacter autotrophicus (strain ATCC BAA-1158 / Py2) TaxID=78245 RepID=UPI00372AAABA
MVTAVARAIRRALGVVAGVVVVAASVYFGLAIHYWIAWPADVRQVGSFAFPLAVIALWFAPGLGRGIRRVLALVAIATLGVAFFSTEPIEQDWVALQQHNPTATIDGDKVTIRNFRDALHWPGAASVPRWTTATFDLSTLTGADLIIQPFGDMKALAHVMLSFGFADGRHVVVSIEARQAKGASFDAVAGFFRRDPIYPELGSERDLIWSRLARTPPDEVQIFPIHRDAAAIRLYFERILAFINRVDARPIFYSTLRESCMTTLMNLAPESFAQVPWHDMRRWIPGYALSLFQQLGLVDDGMSPEEMARTHGVRDGIRSPEAFPTEAAWSGYLRAKLPVSAARAALPSSAN